jgi:hypothetical protein
MGSKSLAALFLGRHRVVHVRELFGPGTTDLHWIQRLDQEGSWIVISGDRRITRNKAEYHAFSSSRLIGFFLSKGLQKAPVIKQMERLCALWPTIETAAGVVAGGAMFELPMTSTRLRQLK